MFFRWSLRDSSSCQVSSSQQGFWMVTTRPLISESSSPFINPLVTVESAPIAIGITVTFMFHSFSVPSKDKYRELIFVFAFFCFARWQSPLFSSFFFFFFFLTMTRFGRLPEIRWSVFISNSQRSLCVSFSRTYFGLCIYHLLLSIFTNPSARAGYDTRSIFKRSLTGLNSEFSFS